MFERELWEHVENPIHCLVHNSDKIWNTFHYLLGENMQKTKSTVFWEGSDMWKTTSTA